MSTHNTYSIKEIPIQEWFAAYSQFLKENRK